MELSICGGIKFESIFNELTYFHVCEPGLPPCLGHDLFKGILNWRISQFKYLGNATNNKPCEVNPGAGKLSRHAVQNWCFL